MATPYSDSYSSHERVLVAALPPGRQNQYVAVRMESAMTWSRMISSQDSAVTTPRMTPFPREATDILQRHNATRILVQVGTSASRDFGTYPLDEVEPWHTRAMGQQRLAQRLDLGPSGVRILATLHVPPHSTASVLQAPFEALLRDIVSTRILLAPLFSISIPRLHRHWFSWPDPHDARLWHWELFLPAEGSALSSEGMREFATAFSPCHNQSGIFQWNHPKIMSELFVKRHSSARHSLWIQLEQQQQQQDETEPSIITTTTRLVKGLQFQPNLAAGESFEVFSPTCPSSTQKASNRTVSLADLFPQSTRQQLCPFVQETTLETVELSHVRLLETSNRIVDQDSRHVNRQTLNLDHWKDPWMTILPSDQAPHPSTPRYSVHQTLRRPRGVSYAGQLVTQVVVHPSSSGNSTKNHTCQTSVHVQWFLPSIVVPQWQSLQVVWEDAEQQVERLLDWRHDLNGSITMIDPQLGSTDRHNNNVFDDGTLQFQIPHWRVPSSSSSSTHAQTLTFSLDYRPAFLSFENFPGDANRGVEIPPARATFVETCDEPQPTTLPTPIQLYSNSLLLIPPVPDMSMPFNVLSMTCSLYAFIIGSLINLLIRKSSERVQYTYDPSKAPPPNKLRQLVSKIKEKVRGLTSKKKGGGVNGAECSTEEQEAEASDGPNKATNEPDPGSEATTSGKDN